MNVSSGALSLAKTLVCEFIGWQVCSGVWVVGWAAYEFKLHTWSRPTVLSTLSSEGCCS